MDVPELVADRLGEESVTAHVDLGDGDAVFATPTRTLRYHSDGILRDASVEEVAHDVDRIELSTRRGKVTLTLSTPEETGDITVPASAEAAVLETVFEGVLGAADLLDPDGAVRAVYRFSDLTLVVTDARLFTHVGGALWAPDHEELPFADATHVDFEEGTQNSQLVVAVEGRAHRVKLPADDADAVRRTVERAFFDHYDVDSLSRLNEALAPDDAERDDTDDASASSGTGAAGLSLDVGGGSAAETSPEVGGEGVEARLAALEEAVEHQTELVEAQQELLDDLVEELRRLH